MRQSRLSLIILSALLVIGLFQWSITPAQAGAFTLNNNSGTTSSPFFIDGEPTLVMNGFDLSPLNLGGEVVIDVVTLAVQQSVAGQPIEVVIYEDGNGGSPIDATLKYQFQAFIETGGTAFITLPEPVRTSAPVVWVGFYLPNGFRFFGDNSGTSVLTYWAWSPGTTFNLADLSSAQILGPGDGSAPVNIDMDGVARITMEVTPLNESGLSGDGVNDDGVPVGVQIDGGDADLSLLSNYPFCGDRLLYDDQDVRLSGRLRFTTHCRADLGSFSPGTFINADDLPATVPSYERRGFFYEVFVNGETAMGSSEEMLVPVTHCLRPEQGEVPTAVIGVAYGAPRAWEILPTVRYGEWVCAELTHAGFLSYFVPRTGEEPTLNADLYFIGNPNLEALEQESSRGLLCGYRYQINYRIRNEGFVATPETLLRVQIINQRTGNVVTSVDITLLPILPGDTVDLNLTNFVIGDTFVGESTITRYIIDPNNTVAELNEENNSYQENSGLILFTNRC
ncbi:MAG: CARDB domain-containing protein [Chloroflexota bacterium]